jgi:hypothetical protein
MTKKSRTMPPAKPTSAATDDELVAAVEAYENSEEGKTAGKPKPDSRAAQLTKAFNETPEMLELRQTAGSIMNKLDPEDTVSIKIDVPKEFVRLVEFLEKKRAAADGAAPRSTEQILNQSVVNELHDQLHWMVVGPARYPYYRDLWNRFCDAQGAPEEKIPDGTATAQEGEDEGPF